MKLEYINIIDAIQYAVDKIVKEEYKKDADTSPKFTVSQYDEIDKQGRTSDHKILLTVEHMNWKRSITLFPRLDYQYGYESLDSEIKSLYNSTM